MSARAATPASSHSKGLILAVLVDRNELSLRELVLCFVSCKAFKDLLDGRGFCIGTAWLWSCLESGQRPTEILSRLRSARGSLPCERPLSRAGQVTSFLMRYQESQVPWPWAWAQLLYQEPDEGVLCEGVKKMRWMLKHELVKELHKTTGYYPGLCSLTGHSGSVSSVAWSPDGRLVASGSSDKTIRIWDVATGKEAMGPLKGHSEAVTSVAWSPDSKLVASGSLDKTIRIWDVATGKEVMGPLTGHSNRVLSVAWSPCGKFVASGSRDGTIKIWDALTGSEKCSLRGHSKDNPECTCTHKPWYKWYKANPECPVTGHSSSVGSVAWSPCGKFVASGSDDGTVKICDIQTGSEKCSLRGHSQNNPECTCKHGWRYEANPECPVKGHSSVVTSVIFSPDGKQLASGSEDWTIRIWDVATGKEAMGPLTGHSDWVRSVAWSPDSKLVASGSYDHTIRIWDVATGKEVMGPLKGHSSDVTSVVFSPDGKQLASGSWDKTIRIWDVATGKEAMGPLKGHSAAVNSIVFSPDGKYVASGSGEDYGSDNSVRIWEVATAKEKCSLTGHSDVVTSVAWSPDSKLVASGSYDHTIRIWDVATGKEVMGPLKGHSSDVTSVVFSPDGKKLASGSWDKTIRIWDVATGKEAMGPLTGHSEFVTSVAWSPCGKFVASGSKDGTVKIWDVETGSEKCSLTGTIASWQNLDPCIKELAAKVHEGDSTRSKSGPYIVTANDYTVVVHLATADREEPLESDGEESGGELLACFCSPTKVSAVSCTGTSVVVGCQDGQVLFLEAPALAAS